MNEVKFERPYRLDIRYRGNTEAQIHTDCKIRMDSKLFTIDMGEKIKGIIDP